jgi:glycosyltransferase involved in cell wall biosynthesis
VRQVHAEYPVDVLSSHSPLQGLGAAGELRRHDVYINYTVHSPFDDELLSNAGAAGPNLMQRLAGRMARWVDRRNVTLADRVQTDSAYTLRTFERKFGRLVKQKGVVAPGWVEADLFQPAHNRRQLRTQLGGAWNTDDPVFFTLRRLESRMGLDTLVQACSMVARAGLRFQVLIGGDGSQRELLQQMIEDAGLQSCVRLLGRLPEEQLASAYAAADCFVLPTRALECFGLIVLESFACNTPVIASSVAAIPELAERQGTEWMFEPNRADQLADRMNDFLSGRLQVTRNLRNLALEFDKPTILKQWERLLRPHPSPQPVISVS